MDAVSNIELNEFFRNEPKFVGTFSRDTLPQKKLKTGQGMIINLDHSNGPGSHWTCLFKYRHGGCCYIDSFGLPPPEEVKFYCKPDKLLYSTGQLQEIKSSKCGLFCAVILRDLFSGRPLYDSIYGFTQKPSDFNEKKAKGLKNKLT